MVAGPVQRPRLPCGAARQRGLDSGGLQRWYILRISRGAAVRVLVACERSGIVREAFRARGHDAWSCDLEAAEDGSRFHYRRDALEVAWWDWDMMIAHPECTYLSVSGLHWNKRRPERALLTEEAVEFALALWNAPIERIAMENPIGILSTRIRKPDQIIQPYEYGEDASKATCLWLRGLPLLRPTRRVQGRIVIHNGKLVERWANQTDSGQNKLGPSPTRSMDRARTYRGIAEAMADQWVDPMTLLVEETERLGLYDMTPDEAAGVQK